MTRLFSLVFALVLCAGLFGGHSDGYAQSRSLDKRLDAVEKQLKAVQRKVFKPGSYFPDDRQSGNTPSAPPVVAGTGLADMEARIAEIETQMRQLTGQIEETNHRINILTNRLETVVKDYEFRIADLERARGSASAAVAPAASAPAVTAAPAVQAKPQVPVTSGAILQGATPKDQYNYAFSLVRKGDYAKAEAALKEFVKQHPKDDLAGNAQYWLGQSYFVRKQYTNATRAFLEGYNTYPNNSKAPSYLLKIGMSLNELGEKSDACDAYRELAARYPDSIESKQRRAGEERKAGCQ